jgi:hypothetical protein
MPLLSDLKGKVYFFNGDPIRVIGGNKLIWKVINEKTKVMWEVKDSILRASLGNDGK